MRTPETPDVNIEAVQCRVTSGCQDICKQLGKLVVQSDQESACSVLSAVHSDGEIPLLNQETSVNLGGISDGFLDLGISVNTNEQTATDLTNELFEHVTINFDGPLDHNEQALEVGTRLAHYLHGSKSVIEAAGRSLTPAARTMQGSKQIEAAKNDTPPLSSVEAIIQGKEVTDDLINQIQTLDALARTMTDLKMITAAGIIVDEQVTEVLTSSARALSAGQHVLLRAEPGVAKSSITKLLSRMNDLAMGNEPTEPLLVAAESTTVVDNWLSQITDVKSGDTVRSKGPLAQAIEDGRLLIIEEINGLDPNQRQALNDILLLSPGDSVRMPEGEYITIKKGFNVVASENPLHDNQGQRRLGREKADSAAAGRFTSIELGYPHQDSSNTYERLVFARLYAKMGVNLFSGSEGINMLRSKAVDIASVAKGIAKAASVPSTEASSIVGGSGKPELSASVTPRDLDKLVKRSLTIASSPEAAAQLIEQEFCDSARSLYSNNSMSDEKMLKIIEAKLATLG